MCTCVEGIAKYFLFITNLLICILSLVVVGMATWVLVDEPSFLEVLQLDDSDVTLYTAGVVVLMVVAVLAIILACFGCCGAIKENRCMLCTYTVLMGLLLALVATGVILAFVTDVDGLERSLEKSLESYNPKSNNNDDEALVDAWDTFQQDFECCGVESYKDWKRYNDYYKYNPEEDVPESCCPPGTNDDRCMTNPARYAYDEGCLVKVENFVEDNAAIIGGIAIGILVIMILNFAIAFYMCCCGHQNEDIRPSKKTRYHRPNHQDI